MFESQHESEAETKFLSPRQLFRELPLTEQGAAVVGSAQEAIADILAGRDDRLFVIVGPCSIHDPGAALDYATRLQALSERLSDYLVLIMRCYVDKPRSISGWNGLANDPDLDGTGDINKGLRTSRDLVLKILGLGLPVATEFVHTEYVAYLGDTFAWIAIGARSALSQPHRELAAFFSGPVGIKNGVDGGLGQVVKAIQGAQQPQTARLPNDQGEMAAFRSPGNPLAHLVLRGGDTGPNYGASERQRALELLSAARLPGKLVVDCNHGNSGSNDRCQLDVLTALTDDIGNGDPYIAGLMIESYLQSGRQPETGPPYIPDLSMTDPCISWDETEERLNRLASAVVARRR